jgi:uncharacterized protein (DUF488 family)
VPHYNKQPLSRFLADHGLKYAYLGRELGGRPSSAEFYDAAGHVDYARRMQAADFQDAINRLLELAARARIVIMCAEEDPNRCHRRLLITPILMQRGMTVMHIRGDGRLQTEEELRDSAGQMSLFE